ncbi:MAG: hypothetical protein FWG91_03850 [Lachnospiraceae bacterium]|nr:hypothetical protein [Lachnospiraceae bacterium]
MKKRSLFKDTGGAGNELYAVIFMLAFFIIALFAAEYARALIIARGIRNAAQAAVITAATDNWDNTFKGRREGYSGAWHKSFSQNEAAAFTERISRHDIASAMDEIIGSSSAGGFSQKNKSDGRAEFRYRVTDVVWRHQELGPSDPLGINFEATVTINVQVAWGLNWDDQPPINLNIRAKAIYMPKF